MMLLFRALEGIGGNGDKVLLCAFCNGLITYSDRLQPLGDRTRHLFVNPAGVECDFQTFYSCPGAIAVGEAIQEHTWFAGYSWRLALCRHCHHHLGWRYEGNFGYERPIQFWGILVSHLMPY
jgi:hypothetical protein